MEILHTNPNRFEHLAFHSMFPTEAVGPRLKMEQGESKPAYLPTIEITKLNQERDTDYLISSLILPFENEVATQQRSNPRYIENISHRFEQAWQCEEYYCHLIEVWQEWIRKKGNELSKERTQLEALLDNFGFLPNDQGVVLTAEQHQQTKPFHYAIAWLIERITEYQYWINRAKDAIRVIRETRVILGHYQPGPTTTDATPKKVASEQPGPIGFAKYLGSNSEKLLPFLIQLCAGKKPKYFARLMFALSDLELMSPRVLSVNQTDLHIILKNTFREVGTRERLNQNIKALSGASRIEQAEIQNIKQIIADYSKK